jgi:glutamate-ammonia-ligase adenylyltransferase
LRRLSVAGVIAKSDVAVLIEAERLWRTIQGMLRMTVGQVESTTLPQASAVPMLRAAAAAGVEAENSDALLRRVDETAFLVRALFERYVGQVGE